jgi:Fibronectin type III domain
VRRGKLVLLLLALTPLLLGGCASSSGATAQAAPSAATPWIAITGGSAAPSPTPSVSYSSPAPFATGFLPFSTVSPSPTPTPSGGDCANLKFHNGAINAAGVVPGTTSATVSWYNPGGADLVEYRVTAISQNLVPGEQRDVGWTVIKPGTGCGMLSAPVTGLDRRTNYVFSVDAVFTQIAGEDGTYAFTVARSIPTRTG